MVLIIMSTKLEPCDLIPRIAQGDGQAFAQLYCDLSSLLLRVVNRTVRDPAISEEVTQEAFVEVWRTIERFDPTRARLSTWATVIARRRSVDRVRYEQAQRERDTTFSRACVNDGPDIDEIVMTRFEAKRVRQAIDALPFAQRSVIELAFGDSLTQREISAALDLPRGTVKSRTRSALRALRHDLTNGGSFTNPST